MTRLDPIALKEIQEAVSHLWRILDAYDVDMGAVAFHLPDVEIGNAPERTR
jgi:hypothetical protein